MKKILVIDDENEFTNFLKMNLELRGDYEVVTAPDGKKGVRLAEETNPDIILLDITMPRMDGFETLKELRKNEATKEIPVIMITARSDDGSMAKALRLHDDGYVTKPVKIEELEDKIENILENKGSKE